MNDTTAKRLAFTVEAKPLASALTLLCATVERRNTVPALGCVLFTVAAGRLTLEATNLDSWIAIELDATGAADGSGAFPAFEIRDAVKTLAKDKGRLIDASICVDSGRLLLRAGRSQLAFTAAKDADSVPRFPAWEAGETWETPIASACEHKAEGVEMSAPAAKAFTKFAKAFDASEAVTVERRDVDEVATGLRILAGSHRFAARLDAPAFAFKSAPRSPYSFGYGSGGNAARAYLDALRVTLGLPAIGEETGRLVVHDGRAVGLTVGEGFREYDRTEYLENWTPPEGVEVVDGRCTVDGLEHVNAQHDGGPGFPADLWKVYRKAEQPGALVYPAGSYSLPLPVEQREPVADITVEVDGIARPLRCKHNHMGGTLELELTAEQVAELCGPVDPSTFVEIVPLAFYHGRIIARGAAAVSFNAMQAAFDRNARKALKNCETSADVNLTAHNIGLSWRDKVAAFLDNADGEALCAARPAAEPVEATPAAEPVETERACPSEHWNDGTDYCADCGTDLNPPEPEPEAAPVPEPAAVYAEPMPDAEPAAPAGDLAARLERLERLLGVATGPKRTASHAAAIRRAWRLRREQRERAELDRLALLAVNARNRSLGEETEQLRQRIERAEGFALERAELVAVIDTERRKVAELEQAKERQAATIRKLRTGRNTTARAAVRYRRDLMRTRAQRDGFAANVQTMTRRAADDARTIDALRNGQTPDGQRRRFIMSTRLEG